MRAANSGGIDALVCNVSALAVGNSAETWEKSFRTDMMHTVNAVAAALPFLEKSKSASIALISSVSGFAANFAAGSYGAMKAALIIRQGAEPPACRQGHPRELRVAGQHLFRRRHLAEYREEHARPLRLDAQGQSDWQVRHGGRGRQRRGLPLQPDGEPHLRHQPRDRRRPHRCRVGVPMPSHSPTAIPSTRSIGITYITAGTTPSRRSSKARRARPSSSRPRTPHRASSPRPRPLPTSPSSISPSSIPVTGPVFIDGAKPGDVGSGRGLGGLAR